MADHRAAKRHRRAIVNELSEQMATRQAEINRLRVALVELQRLHAADATTMVELFGVRSPDDTGHATAAATAGADAQSSITTSEPRLRAASSRLHVVRDAGVQS